MYTKSRILLEFSMTYVIFKLQLITETHSFHKNLKVGKNNLEERLINFVVSIIDIAEKMKKSYAGSHLSGQLIRSSTSAALNYGEAQSAESRKDFIHKLKVVLKELRETFVNLKIIHRAQLYSDGNHLQQVLSENNELISIFISSVETASKNLSVKDDRSVINVEK